MNGSMTLAADWKTGACPCHSWLHTVTCSQWGNKSLCYVYTDRYHNISLFWMKLQCLSLSLCTLRVCIEEFLFWKTKSGGWNSSGTSSWPPGCRDFLWGRIRFLQCSGYCGNGIHCAGGRTTWICFWGHWSDWSILGNLSVSRNRILLNCWRSGLDEVAVPSVDWAICSFHLIRRWVLCISLK